MIPQCFMVKDIIEDHLSDASTTAGFGRYDTNQVRLSWFLKFFLQIYYLQYVIVRYDVRRIPERAAALSALCR